MHKFAQGEYDSWKYDHEGRLAAVILLDQLTRNIYRKKKEAFAYDHLSLEIVDMILSENKYKSYAFVE